MKMLSLDPDEHMRWIYDSTHPNYDREHAEYLRARRAAAIRSAPRWMVDEALLNDTLREQTPNAPHEGAAAALSRTLPLDAVVGRQNVTTE